jgi:hypothetical protein
MIRAKIWIERNRTKKKKTLNQELIFIHRKNRLRLEAKKPKQASPPPEGVAADIKK